VCSRVELVHGKNSILPPRGDKKLVLKYSKAVKVFHKSSTNSSLPVVAVIVPSLDVVKIRVDPIHMPERYEKLIYKYPFFHF